MESIQIVTRDAHPTLGYAWLPDTAPWLVLQIEHGMGEHVARYDRVARALNTEGIAVFGKDHRGHGRSLGNHPQGYMGPNGWNATIDDTRELNRYLRRRFPGAVHVMLGHSMGAMLTQQYLVRFSHTLDGAVLSGSPGFAAGAQSLVSQLLAGFEKKRLGPRAHSDLLQKLLFGKSNDAFDPDGSGTGFEWLSRDQDEVQKYVDDPDCGFVLSTGSLVDLFTGAKEAMRPGNVATINRALPLYVFSGTADPVHRNEDNIRRMLSAYRNAGITADYQPYPGGRHEMLNEINRDEVTANLLRWLSRFR